MPFAPGLDLFTTSESIALSRQHSLAFEGFALCHSALRLANRQCAASKTRRSNFAIISPCRYQFVFRGNQHCHDSASALVASHLHQQISCLVIKSGPVNSNEGRMIGILACSRGLSLSILLVRPLSRNMGAVRGVLRKRMGMIPVLMPCVVGSSE